MAEPTKPQQGALAGIAGIGGAVIGIAAGRYLGVHLLIPAGATILIAVILSKVQPPRHKPMRAAVAILGGHAVWMSIGLFYALSQGDRMLTMVGGVEVALLLGGALWLALRPSVVAVIVIGLYEVVSIAVNAYHFSGATFGSVQHRALLAHILVRVAALIAMIVGLILLRRAATAAQPPAFPVIQEPVS
jgi:hypothetical protein